MNKTYCEDFIERVGDQGDPSKDILSFFAENLKIAKIVQLPNYGDLMADKPVANRLKHFSFSIPEIRMPYQTTALEFECPVTTPHTQALVPIILLCKQLPKHIAFLVAIKSSKESEHWQCVTSRANLIETQWHDEKVAVLFADSNLPDGLSEYSKGISEFAIEIMLGFISNMNKN